MIINVYKTYEVTTQVDEKTLLALEKVLDREISSFNSDTDEDYRASILVLKYKVCDVLRACDD